MENEIVKIKNLYLKGTGRENVYAPEVINSRILSILPESRKWGLVVLEGIMRGEENVILREGCKKIREGKFAGWEKEKKVRLIIDFVKEKCKEYKIENEESQLAMAYGLYAISNGFSPNQVQKIYKHWKDVSKLNERILLE